MKQISPDQLKDLIQGLQYRGYITIGPTLQNGAIVYSEILDINDLPIGITDSQKPGHYRTTQTNSNAIFNYVVGTQSIKRFLYPPIQKIFSAKFTEKKIEIQELDKPSQRYAFIGIRACELEALKIHDTIFSKSEFKNSRYTTLRHNSLFIAVNCSKAEKNCFCTSMNTGPEVKYDYDLLLTEINKNERHYFLLEVGSEKGEDIINEFDFSDADESEINEKYKVIEKTKSQIEKFLETDGVKESLLQSFESPVWDDIAKKCLACGNCTMVCPTCFCMTVEDYTDLERNSAERIQKWDSCYTLEFTYIHGGSVRVSVGSRYRQWLTHKFATWQEQFGTFGCVGCGRCITWCPVGIDVTEETTKIKKLSQLQTTSLEEL